MSVVAVALQEKRRASSVLFHNIPLNPQAQCAWIREHKTNINPFMHSRATIKKRGSPSGACIARRKLSNN